MVIIRNRLSSLRAGGPRQFTELRDRLMITAENVDDIPDVVGELAGTGFSSVQLESAPVIIAQPENRIEDILGEFTTEDNRSDIEQAIEQIIKARESADDIFFDPSAATLNATTELINQIREITGIAKIDFVLTQSDFGPENLRFSPNDLPNIPLTEIGEKQGTLDELNAAAGLPEAWETTRGENATIVVFDTAYAEDLISSDRIVDTFHGGDTASVFKSDEGHGTMCAGAAAANSNENVPFNGAAPEADVILVRITDNEGQIRNDIIAQAHDWLMNKNLDGPVITTHSYGIPICSGRPRTRFCNDPLVDVIEAMNEEPNITSFYAAGNEAGTCGHRLSGVTSAITGHNSLADVITVGALLTNEQDAQRYSSHGRGDCATFADPKPNVTNPIPKHTYYGVEDGWEIKDMSTGIFGSSGGTSHATPYTAGMAALIQSAAIEENGEPLNTVELKSLLEDTASPPRATQVNLFGIFSPSGWDARFGHGEVQIASALSKI